MSDYYHDFLSSVTGTGGAQMPIPEGGQAQGFPAPPIAMDSSLVPEQYQEIGQYLGFQDSTMFDAPRPQKGRGKAGAGSGPDISSVKHRRTRSGCFMCRSRRVKVSIHFCRSFER